MDLGRKISERMAGRITFPVPQPDDDQLLVRVDAVGLCYSDVKLIRQGGSHAKLYGRDLSTNPTRVGHEVSLTIVQVGKNLAGSYHAGQRLAVQPDIYLNQRSNRVRLYHPRRLDPISLDWP